MCPIIILYNNLSINPGQFLARKCPLKKEPKCDPKDIPSFLQEELGAFDYNFERKIDATYVKLVQWIVKMNSDALVDTKTTDKNITANTEFLKIRANLINNGLDMATDLKKHVKTLILMYQHVGRQPSKSRLHDIVRCIEMLKAIEIEFRQKRHVINQWVILINRYTSEIID